MTLRLTMALLLLGACGADGDTGQPTSSAVSEPTTTVATTQTTVHGTPTTSSSTTTTTAPLTTTTTTTVAPTTTVPRPDLGNWAFADALPAVTEPCCSIPATGPISPPQPLPSSGWPADGFYSASAVRPPDSADRIELEIRRWIPCEALYENCETDSDRRGIVADPESAIERTLELDDSMIVVIRAIHFPDEEPPVQGTGADLATMLRHLDAEFDRWVSDPLKAGASLNDLYMELIERSADPGFPFAAHEHAGVIAYRGPLDSLLTFFPIWMDWADGDTTHRGENGLYNWWSTLELRNGTPVLYLYADKIAG